MELIHMVLGPVNVSVFVKVHSQDPNPQDL